MCSSVCVCVCVRVLFTPRRYESVVTKLYTGIQCYSCGMRFTSSQTDVYADHLDWHYRLNRSEKDVSRKVTHRRWYYTLTVRTRTHGHTHTNTHMHTNTQMHMHTCARTHTHAHTRTHT